MSDTWRQSSFAPPTSRANFVTRNPIHDGNLGTHTQQQPPQTPSPLNFNPALHAQDSNFIHSYSHWPSKNATHGGNVDVLLPSTHNTGIIDWDLTTNPKMNATYTQRDRFNVGQIHEIRVPDTHSYVWENPIRVQELGIDSYVSQAPRINNRSNNRVLVCRWARCDSTHVFAREAELVRHVRTIHISPQSFVCSVGSCNKVCNRQDNLKEHMKKAHPEFVDLRDA